MMRRTNSSFQLEVSEGYFLENDGKIIGPLDPQLEDMVGRTIKTVHYDGVNLYFLFEKGSPFLCSPYGDCCSHCYIQHISGTDVLQGAVVRQVDCVDTVIISPAEGYGDVIETWGHRITTSRGVCSIEMRLEHNGYYGGYLSVERFSPAPTFTETHPRLLDDF